MSRYGETNAGPKLDRYQVSHEEFGITEVVAMSGENAILQACKEWGASWGTYACECSAVKMGKAKKRLCVRCGYEVYTAGENMCNTCRRIASLEKRDYFKHYPIRRERA